MISACSVADRAEMCDCFVAARAPAVSLLVALGELVIRFDRTRSSGVNGRL